MNSLSFDVQNLTNRRKYRNATRRQDTGSSLLSLVLGQKVVAAPTIGKAFSVLRLAIHESELEAHVNCAFVCPVHPRSDLQRRNSDHERRSLAAISIRSATSCTKRRIGRGELQRNSDGTATRGGLKVHQSHADCDDS